MKISDTHHVRNKGRGQGKARKNPKKRKPKTNRPIPSFSAETILKQLGGNQFIAMTGARNFMKDTQNNSLSFKIPKAKEGINYVKITLTPMDTYDMEFGTIRGIDYSIKQEVDMVYADRLQDIFTMKTGLYTGGIR